MCRVYPYNECESINFGRIRNWNSYNWVHIDTLDCTRWYLGKSEHSFRHFWDPFWNFREMLEKQDSSFAQNLNLLSIRSHCVLGEEYIFGIWLKVAVNSDYIHVCVLYYCTWCYIVAEGNVYGQLCQVLQLTLLSKEKTDDRWMHTCVLRENKSRKREKREGLLHSRGGGADENKELLFSWSRPDPLKRSRSLSFSLIEKSSHKNCWFIMWCFQIHLHLNCSYKNYDCLFYIFS